MIFILELFCMTTSGLIWCLLIPGWKRDLVRLLNATEGGHLSMLIMILRTKSLIYSKMCYIMENPTPWRLLQAEDTVTCLQKVLFNVLHYSGNAYFILFWSFLGEVSFTLLLARLPCSTSLTLNSGEWIPWQRLWY